jgi:hypothetical protein
MREEAGFQVDLAEVKPQWLALARNATWLKYHFAQCWELTGEACEKGACLRNKLEGQGDALIRSERRRRRARVSSFGGTDLMGALFNTLSRGSILQFQLDIDASKSLYLYELIEGMPLDFFWADIGLHRSYICCSSQKR